MSQESNIHHLDITGDACPMTLVRVRLGMDRIGSGETMQILMASGEPVTSIPRTLQEEGHQILAIVQDGAAYRVTLRKV